MVVVSDVHPAPQTTHGFSGRLHGFLTALCLVGDVTQLRVACNEEPTGLVLADADVPWSTVQGAGPLQRSGSRVRRAVDVLTRNRPAMCRFPAQVLAEQALALQPNLVLVAFPYLADLLLHLPPDVVAIALLEEGWERLREPGRGARAVVDALDDRRVRRLYAQIGARADLSTSISEPERRWFLERYGIDTAVVPHAIDTAYFTPGPEESADLDVSVFGDLTRARNVRPTLAVLAEARRHGTGWRWGLVGKAGPEVAAVQGSDVELSGIVPDVRPWYRRSRAVLVPADAGTGVKTTLLQAWATGRPAVVSRHATLGLPIEDEVDALVYDTPEEAVRHLATLLAEPAHAADLATAGRRRVVAERDSAVVGRVLADLVEGALSQRAASSPR